MDAKDRRHALADLRAAWNGTHQWSVVASWIRSMVRIEPSIMRKVARAKFGDLGSWLQNGSKNIKTACGCLVGTTALELVRTRDSFTLTPDEYHFVCTKGEDKGDFFGAPMVIDRLVRKQIQQGADEAGMAAMDLGQILGQGTAVELIKDEINRRLRERRLRLKRA